MMTTWKKSTIKLLSCIKAELTNAAVIGEKKNLNSLHGEKCHILIKNYRRHASQRVCIKEEKKSNLQSIPRTGTHLQWLGLGLLITMATCFTESPWEMHESENLWPTSVHLTESWMHKKMMHSVIGIKRCDKRIWHFTRTGWKKKWWENIFFLFRQMVSEKRWVGGLRFATLLSDVYGLKSWFVWMTFSS